MNTSATENRKMRWKIRELEDTIQQLMKKLKDTREELAETVETLQDIWEQNQALEKNDTMKELTETKEELADTREELDETKRKQADTMKELADTSDELDEMMRRIWEQDQALRKKLATQMIENRDLQREYGILRQKNDDLRQENDDLRQEKVNMRLALRDKEDYGNSVYEQNGVLYEQLCEELRKSAVLQEANDVLQESNRRLSYELDAENNWPSLESRQKVEARQVQKPTGRKARPFGDNADEHPPNLVWQVSGTRPSWYSPDEYQNTLLCSDTL